MKGEPFVLEALIVFHVKDEKTAPKMQMTLNIPGP